MFKVYEAEVVTIEHWDDYEDYHAHRIFARLEDAEAFIEEQMVEHVTRLLARYDENCRKEWINPEPVWEEDSDLALKMWRIENFGSGDHIAKIRELSVY